MLFDHPTINDAQASDWCAGIGVVEKAVGTVLEKSESVLLIGIPDMNRESSGDPDAKIMHATLDALSCSQ